MTNPFEKPYTREGYDAQQAKVEEARRAAAEQPGHTTEYVRGAGGESEFAPSGSFTESSYERSSAEKKLEKQEGKLAKMKDKAHGEALGFEEQHRALQQAVKNAEEALRDFEKTKLGQGN
ncbi:MAG: hypothetical protein AAB460_02510 [Patescibacteria group bacterium]